MPAPIITTKLYIPQPRRGMVPRPRLVQQLNDGLAAGCKLTVTSAPAGFGKTTLIGEWLAGCGQSAAWLALDEGENDPARFLAYLVAALQTVDATIGNGALAALQAPMQQGTQPTPFEAILTTLLNEIASAASRFILVLDDYHVIDSKAVDQALAFLVEHQPPQMHLVIATREDPPLPLARLRAGGQLTELRLADLRFIPVEAADFLNRVMGLHLSDRDIAALEARTEGWIAGLQLAALSMQGRPEPSGFIETFTGSHHFVLDYLVEEVLQQQSESNQAFLLRTSILNRLCAPLCDAILASTPPSAQKTLESLERLNLFIVPLDNERRWYRYHHLFAELLHQRLGKPADLAELHLRASRWYAENGDPAEAFHHALAAGDCERAAQLAEEAWDDMDRSFQTAAWIGWMKKLPDAVVCSRPMLCLQLGRAYSDIGELEASEIHLQNAERALAGRWDADAFRSLPGNIALTRAGNAQNLGNLAETVKYAELSMRLIPADDIYLRSQAAITLGFTHWAAGNLETSLQAMQAWIEAMQKLGNRVFAIASAFAVADMLEILGRLGEAEKILRLAIQQAAEQGPAAETVTAHHHLKLALLAHEHGNDTRTGEHLQIAANLGQHTTLVDWAYRWNLAQARLKESAGEWDAALEMIEAAARVYVKNPVPMLRPVAALQARVYLKQGRLDKAAAWARQRSLQVTDEVSYLGEYESLTLARVRLAEGVFSGMNELLERLLALAETQKRTASVIEILLTYALVYQAQGNQSQALALLQRVLTLAEPEGYLRIFVDEGEAMRRLLVDFKSSNERQAAHARRGYVDKILAAFSPPGGAGSQSTMATRDSEMIEPLTGRELEILRLIAGGCSNTEISRRLYLALSTVKGHNLRIFDKLQAQNRTEAVARARELGLL